MKTKMYLATAQGLNVIEGSNGTWRGEVQLQRRQVRCVAVDSSSKERVYCGTFGNGVYRSDNAGASWRPCKGLPNQNVMALATADNGDAGRPALLYTGTEPSAIMALCSLLIETMQSYRYGLPTTYDRDYRALSTFQPPPEFDIPKQERRSGRQAFEAFFSLPQHQALFKNVDGDTFYSMIRNGILHQAQTKGGWTLRTGQPVLWNSTSKILDRDRFAVALSSAFDSYIEELNCAAWDDKIWKKARRKLWWLVQLSQ